MGGGSGFGSAGQNASANSQRGTGSGIMKNPTNNASLEFKSPKNLTSSGRYSDSQQLNTQSSQPSNPAQPSYQSPLQSLEQVPQGFPAPTSPTIPIV